MISVQGKNGQRHMVPCGKCAFCLENKRSQWQFRVYHEMRTQWHPGWFLTLTYHEKFVKRVPGLGLSLRFRDVQLFLKRLRKAGFYCKYICVGEYGGQTKRPHYHMILWTDASDQDIQDFWFYGNVHFGRLTMASAMYTLKYIIQPKQEVVKDGAGYTLIEKTRAQFSKGLGLAYMDTDAYNYHTGDEENPNMFAVVDGRKVALPRYFKCKIFTKYQMALANEQTREEGITKKAKAFREALKVLETGQRKTLLEWVKAARSYVREVRAERARLIIAKTKYSQSL